MSFEARYDGLVEMQSRLAGIRQNILQEATRELTSFGEDIMKVSKERVPVEWGILMGTGHAEPATVEGDMLSMTIGYGGPAAPYALEVHENMNPNVNWTRPGSGPKYLEGPVHEMEGDLLPRMREAQPRAFK